MKRLRWCSGTGPSAGVGGPSSWLCGRSERTVKHAVLQQLLPRKAIQRFALLGASYSSESACVTSLIHVSPLIACGHPSVVTANNATCSSSAAARPSASPRRACEWTAPCELAPIASARWTSLLVRPSSGPVWLRAAPSCCKAAQTSGCSFAMCCGTGGKATSGFSERSAGDDRSIGGSLMCRQLQHNSGRPSGGVDRQECDGC
jgi:hypothetical protein